MNQEPNNQTPAPEQNNHYYTAPDYGQTPDPYAQPEPPKGRGYSVASLVLGIFGLVCCCLGPVGLIPAVLAIVFAVISRRRLGALDGMGTAGLICGILGSLIGAYMTFEYVLMFILMSDPTFMEEYFAMMEEILGSMPEETAFFSLFRR